MHLQYFGSFSLLINNLSSEMLVFFHAVSAKIYLEGEQIKLFEK